jgi:hypothetical protein
MKTTFWGTLTHLAFCAFAIPLIVIGALVCEFLAPEYSE